MLKKRLFEKLMWLEVILVKTNCQESHLQEFSHPKETSHQFNTKIQFNNKDCQRKVHQHSKNTILNQMMLITKKDSPYTIKNMQIKVKFLKIISHRNSKLWKEIFTPQEALRERNSHLKNGCQKSTSLPKVKMNFHKKHLIKKINIHILTKLTEKINGEIKNQN